MNDYGYTGLLAIANGWKARALAAEGARDALAAHVERLRERLGMCRHHANYSIGESDALALQLATIRKVANEALREEPSTSLAYRDAEKRIEGALAIRHLTHGEDWEDDDLRAVIDDYIAGLRRQAEGGAS